MMKSAIITVSDRCSRNERKDKTGYELKKFIEDKGFEVAYYKVVPDEKEDIKREIIKAVDNMKLELVITDGGTGFSKRDVTPDATIQLIEKPIPGFSEIMRGESYKITQKAVLSRQVSGIRGESIIVNLPGNPKAAIENLGFIIDALPHGIKILKNTINDCSCDTEKNNKVLDNLSHINIQGRAKMVDVSNKEVTVREAVAEGCIYMNEQTLKRVINGGINKGDVLSVAQVSGIMAAKNTSNNIPMCHPIPISGCDIEFEFNNDKNFIKIRASVRTESKTGVEMEALSAVSTCALTIYDMCKAIDRGMIIKNIMLMKKTGGKSGAFERR